LLLALLPAACSRPPPQPAPHYVLGQPYPAGGVWYYPRERYDAVETGIAMIYPADHPDLTTDGEVFDQTAMAAAHPTLQLPAIASVTNLENGMQVLVRINDRGPATPHRLIEVTQRVAQLLGMPADGVARVRLQVLPVQSRAAVDAMANAPKLDVQSAPRGAVEATDLPPPGAASRALPTTLPSAPAAQAVAPQEMVQRLPESRSQVPPAPGSLYVRLGTFQNAQYAGIQRARVANLGASVATLYQGRVRTYRVMIGPIATIGQADAVLDQVLRAGVTDAQIVVE
jgi:rare lipoprotein A